MHPRDSFLDYTFNKNKQIPMSSFATERDASKTHFEPHNITHKQQSNYQHIQPRFLSLISQNNKLEYQELQSESADNKESSSECGSIFSDLCGCGEIEKERGGENPQRISKSSRVDLSHLNRKKKQLEIINNQKRSLTPINSLVKLIKERKQI